MSATVATYPTPHQPYYSHPQVYGNVSSTSPAMYFPEPSQEHVDMKAAPQQYSPLPEPLAYQPRQTGYEPRPAASAGTLLGGGEPSIYAQAKAAYDNPLAHNESWSPTAADARMYNLPKIDIMLRVKSRLTRKAGEPFDIEPRSFQRPVPRIAPQAFRPIVLQSESKANIIGEGFKPQYSGPLFAAHDISAADFARFLEDIFTAGKVGGAGQVVAAVAPMTMHMGITGYFVTRAITRGMARRNEPLVKDTIETWAERFFGPRGIDVYVVQGGERVTASRVGQLPEPLSGEMARFASGSSSGMGNDAVDAGLSKREREKRDRAHKRERRKGDKGKSKGPILVFAPFNNAHMMMAPHYASFP